MSWRYIIIKSHCKLTYKNGYLVVHSDMCHKIHLSEINTLLIENTDITISGYLISKLLEQKIKIIFCDNDHDPQGEIISYYGAHDTSKKVISQAKWTEKNKDIIWTKIIQDKIISQKQILEHLHFDHTLDTCLNELKIGDCTNQEGRAAKIYFHLLFGKDFKRDDITEINAALNYGYTLLLSVVNREISKLGYITQLGIHHCNMFNYFNLSCDLMEPFRPIVDLFVYHHQDQLFNQQYKHEMMKIFNHQISLNDSKYYLNNAIHKYCKFMLESINEGIITKDVHLKII